VGGYALHELKRTKEAHAVLLPIADSFLDEYMISYNLACYACQLENRKESLQWLGKAIDLAGKKRHSPDGARRFRFRTVVERHFGNLTKSGIRLGRLDPQLTKLPC
jgi:hypothetical protein